MAVILVYTVDMRINTSSHWPFYGNQIPQENKLQLAAQISSPLCLGLDFPSQPSQSTHRRRPEIRSASPRHTSRSRRPRSDHRLSYLLRLSSGVIRRQRYGSRVTFIEWVEL